MKRINQIFERLAGSALKAAPLAILLGGAFASSQIALAQVPSPQGAPIAAQSYAQLAPGSQLRGYYTVKPWDHGTGSNAERRDAKSFGGDGNEGGFNGMSVGGGGNGGGYHGSFSYSITSSKDGQKYTGTMMGPSPWGRDTISAVEPVVVVPLRITIGGSIFAPSDTNPCDSGVSTVSRFQSSPLVQGIPNLVLAGQNVGTTQWFMGFRRAEFWNLLTQNGYNPLFYDYDLSYTTAPDVPVNTLDGNGQHGTTYSSGCSLLGVVSNKTSLDSRCRQAVLVSRMG